MKKLLCLLAITCASPVMAADYTAKLEVAPGIAKHWIAPEPFTTVVSGTPEVVEILKGSGRELVFVMKPEGGMTNILLLNDEGEQVANILVVNPSRFHGEIRQGPGGWELYKKDNNEYVRPKEKKL